MSYVDSNLVSGGTVIYQTRLHWIVMLGHIVLGCLLLGLPGVIKTGVVSRKTIEMLLNKVESIEVSETCVWRIATRAHFYRSSRCESVMSSTFGTHL
jgi:acyl-coenzyme A synthetase/AMP-(fatty) acid ligase